MSEFMVKKAGEVAAFSVLGRETFERGAVALTAAFGAKKVREVTDTFRSHLTELQSLVPAELLTVFEVKVAGTGQKLREMRDLYLGDRWDDTAEHLEWGGFFEGAAIVHWQLVEAGAAKVGLTSLAGLAGEAVRFHTALFEAGNQAIRRVAEERAEKGK